METPSPTDIRRWSRVPFAEYNYGADPDSLSPVVGRTSVQIETDDTEVGTDDASGFAASGKVLLTYGSLRTVVTYASKDADSLNGVTFADSSGSWPENSKLEQYEDDELLEVVIRAASDFEDLTGLEYTQVDTVDEPLVREATQLLVEWKVMAGQQETVETAGDFDLIGSFSAGSYSETRRGDNRRPLVMHPWPRLNQLLLRLLTDEKRAELGIGEQPAVEAEDPVDWESARNIIDAQRNDVSTPFGTIGPPWF